MRIWTDGGCIGNGQADAIGAWAFVSEDGHESSGRLENTTNNRAELQAIIEALRYAQAKGVGQLTILSDSMWAVKCGLWQWKRKANLDLWRIFDALVKAMAPATFIQMKWVKAHSGVVQNERADALCTAAMAQTIDDDQTACEASSLAVLRSIATEEPRGTLPPFLASKAPAEEIGRGLGASCSAPLSGGMGTTCSAPRIGGEA